MRFRNYCVVVMGDTKNVLSEIEKISETKPNVLDAKGIVIATFSSVIEPKEISDWLKLNKRNFLVFDLDKEVSGFNIIKKNIHQGLFGFLENTNLKEMDTEFLKSIELSSDTKTTYNTKTIAKNKQLSEDQVAKMTRKEKDDLWNKIMDNGVENLTEQDKKLLQILSK